MKSALLLSIALALLTPTLLCAQEVPRGAAMEKRLLFGPETAKDWSTAESTLETSSQHLKVGQASLHWHVTVDYTTGEPNYPIGWPRINHAIPAGPARDWSAWDYLHMWVYTDTSRPALPKEPAALVLYAPDRSGEYERPLSELRKGKWVEINIPVPPIPQNNDVRLLQFYLAEANYRDQDRLDLYIDDLSLVGYARPTLLEFAPERAVLFADVQRLPVHLRLAGIKPGERVPVTCELRRVPAKRAGTHAVGGGRIVTRASAMAGRGPHSLSLEVGRKGLAPGTYELTARIANSPPAARARVQLVESPWR